MRYLFRSGFFHHPERRAWPATTTTHRMPWSGLFSTAELPCHILLNLYFVNGKDRINLRRGIEVDNFAVRIIYSDFLSDDETSTFGAGS